MTRTKFVLIEIQVQSPKDIRTKMMWVGGRIRSFNGVQKVIYSVRMSNHFLTIAFDGIGPTWQAIQSFLDAELFYKGGLSWTVKGLGEQYLTM